MPALKLASCGANSKWSLTTRPFAGDDVHFVCALHGVYRAVQLICVIPCWISLLLFRLDGGIDINGLPSWCQDPLDNTSTVDQEYDPLYELEQDDEVLEYIDEYQVVIVSLTLFLALSLLYTFLDLVFSLSVWSASNMGTPTDPRNRDGLMRSLIWMKITFINLCLFSTFAAGVTFVVYGRRHNYACGDGNETGIDIFENSPFYILFSITMVTYAGEILLWPCIILNQISKAILTESRERSLMNVWYFFSRSPHTLKKEYEHQYRKTAVCIGDCLKCLQFMSCNKLQGGHIRSEVDLSDAAVSIMDFFNVESNFDIVLSDVYVAFKLLNRLRRTKTFEANHHAQLSEMRQRESLEPKTKMLQPDNPEDMLCIHEAARYADYALGIYDFYHPALSKAGRFTKESPEVFHPHIANQIIGNTSFSLSNWFWLGELDHPNTALVYASFEASKNATPYCILFDNDSKKVVVSVRGSASLDDLVTDIQMSPACMEDVGKTCGFDGKDFYAHRGILTRAKWIVNDIKERKVLRKLLPPHLKNQIDHPHFGYSLVFTGHSLGAACATMLSTMFKPQYQDVKCYAFCPPGCSVSMNYAEECKDYVISIVCGNDLIPRVTITNFEVMRYEVFETLARIKCSKMKCFVELRKPCKDIHIPDQLKRLLYDKEDIPTHTAYYKQLQEFRDIRQKEMREKSPPETRLTIAGRIIHLKHCIDDIGNFTKEKYVPFWETHDSFNELSLSLDAILEHSMDGLLDNLKSNNLAYGNILKGIKVQDYHDDDPESMRADPMSEQCHRELFEDDDDDGWFMLCSRPRGLETLLPAVLSTFAILLSIAGNNVCHLLSRRVHGDFYFDSSETTQGRVDAISFGLYDFGFEYYNDGSDIMNRQCSLHSPVEDPGIYVRLARGSSSLAVLLGLLASGFLTMAHCMNLSDKTFMLLSFCLIVATICESLVFLLLKSDACHANPDFFVPLDIVLTECSVNTGSALTICAILLWFASAVLTAIICYPANNKRPESQHMSVSG